MNPNLKRKIFDKYKSTCVYCRNIITKKRDLTLDHVYPKRLGGKNTESNLVSCCRKCNLDKGHLLLPHYLRAFEIEITPEIAEFL